MAKGASIIKRRPAYAAAGPSGRLRKVYLAVANSDEGEGVYAVAGANGERLPLLAIDQGGLKRLKTYSQHLANSSGQTVSIICFTERSAHATFRPSATRDKGSS